MHFRMQNPFLESADFTSDFETLRTEVVKEQAHIVRIRSELQALDPSTTDSHGRDQAGLPSVPTYSSVDDAIILSESERLAVHREDFAKEKSHLGTLLAQVESQLSTLEKQYADEHEGSLLDNESLKSIAKYYEKGTVPLMRYTDERRAVLLSSSRVLQTMATLAQVKRDRSDIARRMQKLEDQRKLDLLDELQLAEVALAAARSKLHAAADKLLYTGIVKSQLTRGAGRKPQIVIFRVQKTGAPRIDATDDSELFPGDVVEITLHFDYAVDGSPRAQLAR
jgi:polysaccharide export outer membrane protein